jgi:hypothetical protein
MNVKMMMGEKMGWAVVGQVIKMMVLYFIRVGQFKFR